MIVWLVEMTKPRLGGGVPTTAKVYDCNPNVIKQIIGECFGFEYYIIDKKKEWLLCKNHHNRLIGIGKKIISSKFNWLPN